MTIFETERLIVREYTDADFEHFFPLNSDPDIVRYIRPPKTRLESILFFEKVIADYKKLPGLGRWGAFSKTGNQFIGSFAVIPVEESTDTQVGYALLKENWGYGYASELVRKGLGYVRDHLQLKDVAGITEAGNTASQKVLLKNGFEFEKTYMEKEKELFLYRKRFSTTV